MTILDHLGPFGTLLNHFRPFWPFWPILTIFGRIFFYFLIQIFSGRFDTSGSMIPRLVPEISPLDAFCDIVVIAGVEAGVVGIWDSRRWINFFKETKNIFYKHLTTPLHFQLQSRMTSLKSWRIWRRRSDPGISGCHWEAIAEQQIWRKSLKMSCKWRSFNLKTRHIDWTRVWKTPIFQMG